MSTIKADTLSNLAGTQTVPVSTVAQGSAKAWVNFDGTTAPGTIRAAFNVSSVARNSTGNFTINFTTAMPDNGYVVVTGTATFTDDIQQENKNTTSFVLRTRTAGGNDSNQPYNGIAVFR